jgi:hypothetical protein
MRLGMKSNPVSERRCASDQGRLSYSPIFKAKRIESRGLISILGMAVYKPPKHTQFKKGQSGNPRGHPRGAKNLATVLGEVLDEKVTITENGRRRTITKAEAMLNGLLTTRFRAMRRSRRRSFA